MSVVRVKSGVQFSVIAPAGFRILSAIDQVAAAWPYDLILTSACDGEHSGPSDPHHTGEAYDLRSHDMTAEEKTRLLAGVMTILGWSHFYGFLENEGQDTEHFHFQRSKDTVYP